MRRVRHLSLLVLLALPGCSDRIAECGDSATPGLLESATRVEFYFGRLLPNGDQVQDADWQAFLDEALTPAFPDGLTVLDAAGQWRDGAGRLWREPSKLVVVLVFDDSGLEERIGAVAETYKERFSQQAVLIVEQPACVAFR